MSWTGKQRNILDFTLSSLLRRKGRNAALVVVYSFVVFLLASVVFLAQSIKEEAQAVLREAPEIVVQRLGAGRQRNILDSTHPSLLRREGRNAALIVVYAFVVFLLASVVFLAQR